MKPGKRGAKDSLAYWKKKLELPKTYKKLVHYPLLQDEVLKKTSEQGIYAFGCEFDDLYIEYNKKHQFYENDQSHRMNDRFNFNTTRVGFSALYVFFDQNGWVINPDSMTFFGAWGKYRVAGMLPANYELLPVDNIGPQ